MLKIKSIFCILLLLLLPAMMRAGSVIELSIDGGYSTTLYKVDNGKKVGGIGYGADLGYAYFFHKNVGIGLGVGFRHFAGGAKIDGELTYPKVIDTDKEPYDHHTYYNNWREKQDLYYVEIPVSLQFYIPANKVHVWLALGAKYNVAVSGRTAAGGDLTHRGYYEKWDLMLDIADHGFYETSDFKPSQSLKPKNTVSLFTRIDLGIPLTQQLDFIIGFNANYCLMPAFALDGRESLGFRNDVPEWSQAHYFMSDYSSLLNTNIISGKANPLSVGLEIGLKYTFRSHKHKRYECRCVTD